MEGDRILLSGARVVEINATIKTESALGIRENRLPSRLASGLVRITQP